MISPIVKWRHDEDWHVVSYNNRELTKISERVVAIDTKEGEWGYVSGHVIDGKNLEIWFSCFSSLLIIFLLPTRPKSLSCNGLFVYSLGNFS